MYPHNTNRIPPKIIIVLDMIQTKERTINGENAINQEEIIPIHLRKHKNNVKYKHERIIFFL